MILIIGDCYLSNKKISCSKILFWKNRELTYWVDLEPKCMKYAINAYKLNQNITINKSTSSQNKPKI